MAKYMTKFSDYIKAIGKGHRSGRYLTQLEAQDAFTQLLSGDVAPEQAGAFLMLLRVREESVEELAGFVTACRAILPAQLSQLDTSFDMGCYSGKRRHLPWFLLAALCLANHGHRVFLHGTAEPHSKRLYLDTVLSALDIPVSTDTHHAKKMLDTYGLCYMDLVHCHPQLHHLISLRELFGLRSCANTLARMLNPSHAQFSYHGVFHREFDSRHVEVARLLGDEHVSCIRGEGGEVEVNPERDFIQHVFRHGQHEEIHYPTLLPQWQIKPRELDPLVLKSVWQGELDDVYGYQAVIGTLATYLTQSSVMPPEEAIKQAQLMWDNRQRQCLA